MAGLDMETNLENTIRPVVEGAGLELVDLSFHREGGRRILRVTVDREGGVDLGTIAETSERVSRRLDLEEVLGEARYTLEVSSPGIERPLRSPADFARHVGEKVKVRTSRPVDGARRHTGTIVAAGDEAVTVTTEEGDREIAFADIASARTVFEWGPRR